MNSNYSCGRKAIILIASTFIFLNLITDAQAQAWYNGAWYYRKPVTINNPGGTQVTDYQVKISLDATFPYSSTNLDGSDIRITSDDGISLLPFWIEEWNNGTNATIWVKVPVVPIAGTTLYIYYGNTSALSASNGTETFRLFDDFENWYSSSSTGWTDAASLPEPIADQSSVVFNDKIYSIGGYGNGPTDPKGDNWVYDPSTNSWEEKTSMPTARWGMIAVEFNGKIYVFGGSESYYYNPGNRKNEVYDPVTDTWDTTKSLIPEGLAGHGIFGVKYGDTIHLFRFEHHYEYDPLTDTYTSLANVPNGRIWSTCANIGSKIYVIGGDNGSWATSLNEVYDIPSNTWSSAAAIPIGLWGASRENPVINGKIYVTHGLDGGAFYRTNFMYDPLTNTWEGKSIAKYHRDGTGCAVYNNKLYIVGGRADFVGPYGLTYHEVYDPTEDVPPGSTLWASSGSTYVSADTSASFTGEYGVSISQTANIPNQKYLQSLNGFGDVYALDFDWNVTDLLGVENEPRPQGFLQLSETDPDASIYFYDNAGTPSLDWYHNDFVHLQNSTWDNWHKVSVKRNGNNSQVTFDGNTYSSLTGYTGGTGKFKFGIYFATKEYLDNVRVRKWSGFDPSATVGDEQTYEPPAAPLQVSPANLSIGVSSSPTLVWNSSFTASSYNLQLSVLPNFMFVFSLNGLTDTVADITDLLDNVTYYWRVNAVNDRGPGAWSETWSFTTCSSPPTVDAGPDRNACVTDETITMTGYSYSNATGAFWSGGAGS